MPYLTDKEMTDKKKTSLSKPPVPARPKNLIVLNSKHLPKPPETFSSENVTNIIKDLNLEVKDEKNEIENRGIKQLVQRFENSDSEEELYGYLEPMSFSSLKITGSSAAREIDIQSQNKEPGHEENFKFGDMLKMINKKNSASIEVPEVENSKQIPQSQWQRPLPSLPLPPMEIKSQVSTMPWYKNVNRQKGEEILRNGMDGYFLVRPSSNLETYLTLTLWHNGRVYNIPIRKRKDGKFALGTPKTHEQCFDSVEYLVKNYQSEKLVLYSNGVQTGKTLLTTYPP